MSRLLFGLLIRISTDLSCWTFDLYARIAFFRIKTCACRCYFYVLCVEGCADHAGPSAIEIRDVEPEFSVRDGIFVLEDGGLRGCPHGSGADFYGCWRSFCGPGDGGDGDATAATTDMIGSGEGVSVTFSVRAFGAWSVVGCVDVDIFFAPVLMLAKVRGKRGGWNLHTSYWYLIERKWLLRLKPLVKILLYNNAYLFKGCKWRYWSVV